MIAKVITSGSIKSLMKYLTDKEYSLVDMNKVLMNGSYNPVVEEFTRLQKQNVRCKSPNFHIILSFAKDEIITPKIQNDILQDFIKQLVGPDQMWVAIEHPKSGTHQHLHIAMNRIQSNGKALSSSNTAYRCLDICRRLEKKYNLQQLSSFKGENQNIRKEKLKEIINVTIRKVSNMNDFKVELRKHQFKVLQARGIAFIDKQCGAKIKGSDLGREYSLMYIKKRIEMYSALRAEMNSERTQQLPEGIEPEGTLIADIANFTAFLLKDRTRRSYQQEEYDPEKERKKRKRRRGRRM
ncbi:relaxase/mobilization nuclease domain-containing protein [uncultured Marixanthomonas sp.]|uniref:relaxase/mobilization nuclease domain-containing protein n=1 Tax=uncultured Marixanthomonas sp. TaxID=757245 RepID=UPI0030D8A236|tara:strand:- start:278382 stop:279269 length:888 start_codon:yes stop_codon:yes gene_type:complete